MSKIRSIKNRLPIIIPVLLVIVGLYLFLNIYFKIHPLYSIFLFAGASFSMYLTIITWKWFSPQYAPRIIYWTSNHKYARKLIAGGSFTYYEYKEDTDKVGKFEPFSRFINLMIAFLALSTTIAKIIKFTPESPVESSGSMLTWTLLMIFVPLILTPIIPIFWTMEDLGLKAWNKGTSENWKVSTKYKKRFNSFIAVGALGVGLGLTNNEQLTFYQNLEIYLVVLRDGIFLLTYPVAVLTLLYYVIFRSTVNREVREQMNIVTAKTILEIVDPKTGMPISEKKPLDNVDEFSDENIVENKSEDLKLHQKIAGGTKKSLNTLNKQTVGRVSKVVKKKKKKEINKKVVKKVDKTRRGGSATKGLWDSDDK